MILDLLQAGAINATTCLVETEAWPRCAPALKALCERRPELGVGLHFNVTEAFTQASATSVRRPLNAWLMRSLAPPPRALVDAVLQTFRAQWAQFVRLFGRPPDFLDGHQHVQLYGAPRAAVLKLAMETQFSGWLRQSGTSGARFLAQRILMDPMSERFAAQARAIGLAVNPGFGGLRAFRREEDLERLWSADLDGLSAGGVLIVHPGTLGSPAGTDSIDACRVDEATALKNGVLSRLLELKRLALAVDARRPSWGGAGEFSFTLSRPG